MKFTGPVLADIFQGKITKWNDPQIKALNPRVNLPAANIVGRAMNMHRPQEDPYFMIICTSDKYFYPVYSR